MQDVCLYCSPCSPCSAVALVSPQMDHRHLHQLHQPHRELNRGETPRPGKGKEKGKGAESGARRRLQVEEEVSKKPRRRPRGLPSGADAPGSPRASWSDVGGFWIDIVIYKPPWTPARSRGVPNKCCLRDLGQTLVWAEGGRSHAPQPKTTPPFQPARLEEPKPRGASSDVPSETAAPAEPAAPAAPKLSNADFRKFLA